MVGNWAVLVMIPGHEGIAGMPCFLSLQNPSSEVS
jgi:hypothetical protein